MKKPFLNVTTGLVSFGWWWLYLGLNFVIEELLLELGESVVTAVVIQIQGVQHVPKGRTVLVHEMQLIISKPQPVMGWSYSIMEGSLVSRMWSVRIQGMDISMGNWIRRPMVSSRKNSLNHSWERSQHCCRASARGRENEGMSTPLQASLTGHWRVQLTAEIEQVGEEERMFVEVFDGHHDGPVQTAAEGLLRAALICYEGLQHRAHHVELQGWDQRKERSVVSCKSFELTRLFKNAFRKQS